MAFMWRLARPMAHQIRNSSKLTQKSGVHSNMMARIHGLGLPWDVNRETRRMLIEREEEANG